MSLLTQTVIVMRHGERRDHIPNAPAEGDPPLTEQGTADVGTIVAPQLIARLGAHNAANIQIYVSPFLRCLQTAEALQKCGVGSNTPCIVENGLCEVYGPVRIKTGRPPALAQKVPARGRLPAWGETLEASYARYNDCFLNVADTLAELPSDVSTNFSEQNSVPKAAVNREVLTAPQRASSSVVSVPPVALLVTHGDAVNAVLSHFYPARTVYDAVFLSFIVMKRYGAMNPVFHLEDSWGVHWISDGIDREPHDPIRLAALSPLQEKLDLSGDEDGRHDLHSCPSAGGDDCDHEFSDDEYDLRIQSSINRKPKPKPNEQASHPIKTNGAPSCSKRQIKAPPTSKDAPKNGSEGCNKIRGPDGTLLQSSENFHTSSGPFNNTTNLETETESNAKTTSTTNGTTATSHTDTTPASEQDREEGEVGAVGVDPTFRGYGGAYDDDGEEEAHHAEHGHAHSHTSWASAPTATVFGDVVSVPSMRPTARQWMKEKPFLVSLALRAGTLLCHCVAALCWKHHRDSGAYLFAATFIEAGSLALYVAANVWTSKAVTKVYLILESLRWWQAVPAAGDVVTVYLDVHDPNESTHDGVDGSISIPNSRTRFRAHLTDALEHSDVLIPPSSQQGDFPTAAKTRAYYVFLVLRHLAVTVLKLLSIFAMFLLFGCFGARRPHRLLASFSATFTSPASLIFYLISIIMNMTRGVYDERMYKASRNR